jgi:hypothetical protein
VQSKIETVEPSLAKLLTESAEPKREKSSTDKEDPKRAWSKTENEPVTSRVPVHWPSCVRASQWSLPLKHVQSAFEGPIWPYWSFHIDVPSLIVPSCAVPLLKNEYFNA